MIFPTCSQFSAVRARVIFFHRRNVFRGTPGYPAAFIRHASFKVAIVGSGPSGCYTAKYLQMASSNNAKSDLRFEIDILERLPTPFGLVRHGVAPDHPEVKNVQNDFAKLFEEREIDRSVTKTSKADQGRVRFYGNVQVGKDVSVDELRKLYDVVVLCYGCESDRKLNIKGETLNGVLSAREFVAWYNGHPDFEHIGQKVAQALRVRISDISPGHQAACKDSVRNASVVVIGQGNVALDCARILAKGGPGLYETDLASHALPVLGGGVSQISVVGRRGHIQGAFTIKELRELVKLQSDGFETDFIVRQDELEMGSTKASLEELSGPSGRPRTRIDKLLRDHATKAEDVFNSVAPKRLDLRFLLNPVELLPDAENPQMVGSVVCGRTKLDGAPHQQRPISCEESEILPAQLVLVSIGYKATPLPTLEQWFDDPRGVVIHDHGKIDECTSEASGLYASGWLKRGPSGIIGTNIADAKDTVGTIIRDLTNAIPKLSHSTLANLLKQRHIRVVGWEDYQKIEAVEDAHKRHGSQPREKITNLEEQLKAAFPK